MARLSVIPVRFEKSILANTVRKLAMDYESVRNTPKAFTNPKRIQGKSWLFLTILEIFSRKLGIKAIYLLGYYFYSKFPSWSCCCTVPTIEVSIPAAVCTKKIVS